MPYRCASLSSDVQRVSISALRLLRTRAHSPVDEPGGGDETSRRAMTNAILPGRVLGWTLASGTGRRKLIRTDLWNGPHVDAED